MPKITIHVENEEQDKILVEMKGLRTLIMATQQQFQDALNKIDQETTRVGDLIQQLTAQLNRSDLTEEQESAVLDALNKAGERLKSVGTSVENPVPTEPLPEVPTDGSSDSGGSSDSSSDSGSNS